MEEYLGEKFFETIMKYAPDILTVKFPMAATAIKYTVVAINAAKGVKDAADDISSDHWSIRAYDKFLFDMLDTFQVNATAYDLNQLETKMAISYQLVKGIHYSFNTELLGLDHTYWEIAKEIGKNDPDSIKKREKFKKKFMADTETGNYFYQQYLSQKAGYSTNIYYGMRLFNDSSEMVDLIHGIMESYIDSLLEEAASAYDILHNYFKELFCRNTIV